MNRKSESDISRILQIYGNTLYRTAYLLLGNPLINSFNYEVSIHLGANTKAVRDKIGRIDGVRLITTKRKLKE